MIIRNIILRIAKYSSLTRAVFYKKRFFNLFFVLVSYLFQHAKVKGLPFLVEIEPTNRCNLSCGLCLTGLGKLKRPKGDMALNQFKNIIDQLEEGIIYLVLYNLGEPLLNQHIYQMIKYAKEKKIFIRLSTNANFYNKDIISVLDCGIDELVISLDCVTPQAYLKYKKNPSFERVIDNIKLIVKTRGKRLIPFINLQLLLMRDTENDIGKFKKMVRNLGVDAGLIKKVRIDFPGINPDKSFLPQNDKHIRRAYKDNYYGQGICYRPWISTLIFMDGSVVPCCFDMEGEYLFGNISNRNFTEIWNNEEYTFFRKEMLRGTDRVYLCKQCSFREFFSNFNEKGYN